MTVQNLGTKTTLLSLSASDVVTASANRTGVDLVDYKGDIMAVLDAEAGGSGPRNGGGQVVDQSLPAREQSAL